MLSELGLLSQSHSHGVSASCFTASFSGLNAHTNHLGFWNSCSSRTRVGIAILPFEEALAFISLLPVPGRHFECQGAGHDSCKETSGIFFEAYNINDAFWGGGGGGGWKESEMKYQSPGHP